MILFVYDFPHRKSQDFILTLKKHRIKINLIIAAPKVSIKSQKLPFKIKLNVKPIFHPKQLSEIFNIPYYNIPHNSIEIIKRLKKIKPEIGMIAGARILKKEVIDCFSTGIVNFHPGDIPVIRGLNSSLRAIKKKHPQIVTAHLVNDLIDHGTIIKKTEIELNKDDTIIDINERLYQTQLEMIPEVYNSTINNEFLSNKLINTKYEKDIPYNDINSFIKDFKEYIK